MGYTEYFGGTAIYPSDVSYLAVTLTADIQLDWPLEITGTPYPAARVIDVDATAANHKINLPSAIQTGVGQTILFNNIGANSFEVCDRHGLTLATVTPGTQWQFYVADNTTVEGIWRIFQYGASTATVQASALAGFGLAVTGSTLSQAAPVTTFSTTPYSLAASSRAGVFIWTGTGSANIIPPPISTVRTIPGYFIMIRNSGGGNLNINPSGSPTIDGVDILTLSPGESCIVTTDNTNWFTVGRGQDPVFAFDYTAISVAPGGTYKLSPSEQNKIAYKFTGVLTSNVIVEVPKTVQQYWVNNATTGPYTLSIRSNTSDGLSPGPAVFVNQGAKGIYYCDGNAMILASDPTTLTTPIAISDGGTSATTASAARANLGISPLMDPFVTATDEAAARTIIGAAVSGVNNDITELTEFGAIFTTGRGVTTGTASIEIGGYRTDIGGATLDMHGTAGTSYEARISRGGGVNGTLAFLQTGTGNIVFSHDGTTHVTFRANGDATFTNDVAAATVTTTGDIVVASPGVYKGLGTGLTGTAAGLSVGGTAANVTGTVAVANGGTGATTAVNARANLSAAVKGVNDDITALTHIGDSFDTGFGVAGLPVSMRVGALRTNNGTAGLSLHTAAGGLSYLQMFRNSGVNANASIDNTGTGTLYFNLNGAERMRLESSTGELIVGQNIRATRFFGAVTGDVTGNVSGTAANVTGIVALSKGGTGINAATGLDAIKALTGLGVGTVSFSSTSITLNFIAPDGTNFAVRGGYGTLAANTTTTLSFGITFSVAPIVVVSGGSNTVADEGDIRSSGAATTTGVPILNSSGNSGTYFWLAIGKMP